MGGGAAAGSLKRERTLEYPAKKVRESSTQIPQGKSTVGRTSRTPES